MESGTLDIIIGKGPSARTIQLELPPFTMIAATTRVSMISSPLRSRFSGGVYKLEFYSIDEISKIIERSASILSVSIDASGIAEIAKRSRSTPRTSNYFLKRVRDYAQIKKSNLNKDIVTEALNLLGVDDLGLYQSDRLILDTIINKYNGGPVGLNTIAAALSEEQATIEEYHEPYLIQLGLIERTARGRVVTPRGVAHIKKTS
jgi:Holliday junction DNA helicase RuvB